ncbi:MAG TPA: sialidase family protein, partial [Cyclobacteriaceae bacterium]
MRGFALLLLFVSTVASAQISSQKIGEATTPQNTGASVAVSPKNPRNIVVYAGGKILYSNDLGATWKDTPLTLPSDIFETPTLACDARGNFLVFYTTANQLTCNHSTDDGQTWSEPTAVAPAPGKVQYNPGIGTHPKKEDLMVTWTEVDALRSGEDCKSNVYMSTSGGLGKKWSAAVLVNQNSGNCVDEDFTLRGSAPMIAFDGKVFITWAAQGAMFYDRSYDGNMWISTDLAIKEQAGGWTLPVPGFGKVTNTPSFAGDNS